MKIVSVLPEKASNVYRTKDYIVKQVLSIQMDKSENSIMISRDTYYQRTKERDLKYEFQFCNRKNVDGKRLPSNSYVQTYLD